MFFLSLGVKEKLFQLIKGISTRYIQTLEFLLKSRIRYLLSLLLSNIILKDILYSKRKQSDAKDKTIIIFR